MAYAYAVNTDNQKRKPGLTEVLAKLQRYADSDNVAELLDDVELLPRMGNDVKRDFDADENSREEWRKSADKAMDVALQVRKMKSYPWPDASNIKYPLVTVAALQFGARAYPAIIDGNRVVKGLPLGADPDGKKREKADRVSQHMSWQLLYQMDEWEEDTDVLLHHLPIIGCAFRKVWRSKELGRNKAVMIPATNLVVNQCVRSLDEAPRVTHVLDPIYPVGLEERIRQGIFLDVDLPLPHTQDAETDAPYEFLEQHCSWDLDGDGYREPYIVTIHKDSAKVVRIVANYRMEKIEHDATKIIRIPKEQYFVKYTFLPDPKGGFYDIGFGKLLESLSETIDTTINMMMDAGNLQNAGGGFIGSGLRLKKDKLRLKPGLYQYVDSGGTKIAESIYNFNHPGPSSVLFNLLGMMIEAAKDITAVKDILTGDSGQKSPQTATTTLALIEQGLKVFTSIYKRVYRSLKQEFRLLFELNAQYLNQEEYFTLLDIPQSVTKDDYDAKSFDVIPVADPRNVTDMQKSAKAQVLMQLSQDPILGPRQNPDEVLRRIYEAAGMDGIDQLILPPPQPLA
jgi:chaperonin GroES